MASMICSRGGEDRLDVLVQDELKLLHRVEVGRIAHDDLEHPVFVRQRQDDVFAGHRFGHQFDDGGGDGYFARLIDASRETRPWPT